ncbi:scavenger receptor cysteine-rich domain-containing group B protein-like [Saccoglossus kowalevskii]|uniref:Deleted in malignant brain tumors 1 protein-like n=1 Tax=Saccoglossus kowalevskii TaxID=10224 RepID=A0ABM0MGS0_SACKO|nr:PREDICTED: deleted in malignant brain tumors 1 protein-like [Saccoglossus kowalevskii]
MKTWPRALCILLLFNNVYCTTISSDITVDTTLTQSGSPYEVNNDITINDGITLTVDPGAVIHFSPGKRLTVEGVLRAEGTDVDRITLSTTQTHPGTDLSYDFGVASIRLVEGGSPEKGRLEVNINGKWGTVCNNGWGQHEADVACKQLGFDGGVLSSFTSGSGNIWMDNVVCTGVETLLFECQHSGYGQNNCDHSQDVGLICAGNQQPSSVLHNYWGGVAFTGNSAITSSLKHVDISFTSGNVPSDRSGAVEIIGNPPTFENVRIANCLSSRVEY